MSGTSKLLMLIVLTLLGLCLEGCASRPEYAVAVTADPIMGGRKLHRTADFEERKALDWAICSGNRKARPVCLFEENEARMQAQPVQKAAQEKFLDAYAAELDQAISQMRGN